MDKRVLEGEISAIQLHVNVTVAAPKLLDFKPHPDLVQQSRSFVINLGGRRKSLPVFRVNSHFSSSRWSDSLEHQAWAPFH